MSFKLLTDKETMVTEFKYTNRANYILRNRVARFFNSLKQYKQLFPSLPKVFLLCEICPFPSHAFIYSCVGQLWNTAANVNISLR
jgi:hypothetical protein